MMSPEIRIRQLLAFLYGEQGGDHAWHQLQPTLAAFCDQHPELANGTRQPGQFLDQRDAILITYGDQFREPGRPPLRSLLTFLDTYLGDAVNGVHILPFFPYSSDDGFSVIDYLVVDPALGTWDDVKAIGSGYKLMFDAVVNHVSRESAWFQAFLRAEKPFDDYFITADPAQDLSEVVRPRALPLLTPVETANGLQHVWTTFSEDQIDLNFANVDVLMRVTGVLLAYVAAGADLIRLDAIAFLWKEVGTTCLHLPQTHAVVKLWRAVLDLVAPNVIVITETNVPHMDNISYFGSVLPEARYTDEAQMVYNFSLGPVVLHTLRSGDATMLSDWVASQEPPPSGSAFFNFIASHDGIGMRPAENLLTPQEVQALVDQTVAHRGRVSYRANADGSSSVYELNITLYDFLNDPAAAKPELDIARFLASQAILLSLAGVPGIYVHSLFGSRNCEACVAETGRARSINREKFDLASLSQRLDDASCHEGQVFAGVRRMLALRKTQPAFHPAAQQRVLSLHRSVFALERTPLSGGEPLICLVSTTDQPLKLTVDFATHGVKAGSVWRDLISADVLHGATGESHVSLNPYMVRWLVPSRR